MKSQMYVLNTFHNIEPNLKDVEGIVSKITPRGPEQRQKTLG